LNSHNRNGVFRSYQRVIQTRSNNSSSKSKPSSVDNRNFNDKRYSSTSTRNDQSNLNWRRSDTQDRKDREEKFLAVTDRRDETAQPIRRGPPPRKEVGLDWKNGVNSNINRNSNNIINHNKISSNSGPHSTDQRRLNRQDIWDVPSGILGTDSLKSSNSDSNEKRLLFEREREEILEKRRHAKLQQDGSYHAESDEIMRQIEDTTADGVFSTASSSSISILNSPEPATPSPGDLGGGLLIGGAGPALFSSTKTLTAAELMRSSTDNNVSIIIPATDNNIDSDNYQSALFADEGHGDYLTNGPPMATETATPLESLQQSSLNFGRGALDLTSSLALFPISSIDNMNNTINLATDSIKYGTQNESAYDLDSQNFLENNLWLSKLVDIDDSEIDKVESRSVFSPFGDIGLGVGSAIAVDGGGPVLGRVTGRDSDAFAVIPPFKQEASDRDRDRDLKSSGLSDLSTLLCGGDNGRGDDAADRGTVQVLASNNFGCYEGFDFDGVNDVTVGSNRRDQSTSRLSAFLRLSADDTEDCQISSSQGVPGHVQSSLEIGPSGSAMTVSPVVEGGQVDVDTSVPADKCETRTQILSKREDDSGGPAPFAHTFPLSPPIAPGLSTGNENNIFALAPPLSSSNRKNSSSSTFPIAPGLSDEFTALSPGASLSALPLQSLPSPQLFGLPPFLSPPGLPPPHALPSYVPSPGSSIAPGVAASGNAGTPRSNPTPPFSLQGYPFLPMPPPPQLSVSQSPSADRSANGSNMTNYDKNKNSKFATLNKNKVLASNSNNKHLPTSTSLPIAPHLSGASGNGVTSTGPRPPTFSGMPVAPALGDVLSPQFMPLSHLQQNVPFLAQAQPPMNFPPFPLDGGIFPSPTATQSSTGNLKALEINAPVTDPNATANAHRVPLHVLFAKAKLIGKQGVLQEQQEGIRSQPLVTTGGHSGVVPGPGDRSAANSRDKSKTLMNLLGLQNTALTQQRQRDLTGRGDSVGAPAGAISSNRIVAPASPKQGSGSAALGPHSRSTKNTDKAPRQLSRLELLKLLKVQGDPNRVSSKPSGDGPYSGGKEGKADEVVDSAVGAGGSALGSGKQNNTFVSDDGSAMGAPTSAVNHLSAASGQLRRVNVKDLFNKAAGIGGGIVDET